MFRKWSHGHSLGVGALGALAIAQRPMMILLAGVVLGVVLAGVWRVGRRVAGTIAHTMTVYAAGRAKELARARRLNALSQLGPDDELPF